MATYVTLASFTDQGIRSVKDSVDRLAAFRAAAEKLGVTLKSVHYTVGAFEAMYAALARDDLDAFHAVATPDFHAFDNGRRYDGDALADVLRAAHASGRTHVWTVTEPEVHVDGDSAWVAYVNRGSITQGQETKAVTWLESVMLRREQGAWKVAFLHSTRAP